MVAFNSSTIKYSFFISYITCFLEVEDLTSAAYAGRFQGFPETPPDSESLPFYVLAMQTLLRKAEIIFNTVALRCIADVHSQCFRLP